MIITELERRLETEGTIRLGDKFQVTELPVVGDEDHNDESTCLWSPGKEDNETDDFLKKSAKLNWPVYPALTLLGMIWNFFF